MKWSVDCGVPGVLKAVWADKEVPAINRIMASPRTYLAGGATERATDRVAMIGAAGDRVRPVMADLRVCAGQQEDDFVPLIDEGIGN